MGQFSRRGACVILAFVLAGLPVGAEVCASLCTGAGSAVTSGNAHRISAGSCHQPADGLQLSGTAGHDCTEHASHDREWTLPVRTARADGAGIAPAAGLPDALKAVPADFVRLHFPTGPPPDPAAPACAPLVLRI